MVVLDVGQFSETLLLLRNSFVPTTLYRLAVRSNLVLSAGTYILTVSLGFFSNTLSLDMSAFWHCQDSDGHKEYR